MNHDPGLECRDERRRDAVRAKEGWNGLDYVEVSDDQLKLTIYFLGQAPGDLTIENIRIEGCQRGAREVRVIGLRFCLQDDPELDDCLHLYLDRPGDFSKYRLCVVEPDGKGGFRPFHGFDPRFDCLEVDFKVGCPSDLDCKAEPSCPPEPRAEPEINYLAKDYGSFRQLLLDRLALVMPEWKERHIPDLGIALVEMLAYVGDHLSYYQDAVGTEAYLDTARRRISVRRHVRLVDYPMHDGCNARAWVFVHTSGELDLKPGDFCITGFRGGPAEGHALLSADLANFAGLYETFEPVFGEDAKIQLLPQHDQIPIYAWGDRDCCLPRGATRATLLDEWLPVPPPPKGSGYDPGKPGKEDESCPPPPTDPPRPRKLRLKAGDLLLFVEIVGPKTHHDHDADLSHRHVVRLTQVREDVDRLGDLPVLEIEWAREDALPFPLCLSSVGGDQCESLDGISVARGNVFLADHGRTWPETLEPVPLRQSPSRCEAEGRLAEVELVAERFRPRLGRAPLTFREPIPRPFRSAPAARLVAQDPRKALTQVLQLASKDAGAPLWEGRRDLLASGPGDRQFVAEVDDDGFAHLRFGDGDTGLPPPGTVFQAKYRVGNGPAGNVGIGAIRHLVLDNRQTNATVAVSNPLPARGGTPPEPLAEVRLLAPHAFRQELQRAVTADDYARLVERDFRGRVQRAAATLLWTGSWYEARVVIDPVGGHQEDGLLEEVRQALQKYRRIGHDVAVAWAVSVPLILELLVCIRTGFLRGHVKSALFEALGSRQLPDGRRGFFHPDNLTFGQGIAFSRVIAAAQSVAGVESVRIVKLARLGREMDPEVKDKEFLPIGPLEIARLDNDPQFPGNGQLELDPRGGR